MDIRMKNRYCKGEYYENGGYKEFEIGIFHTWGIDYEKLGEAAQGFTTAIVELPDGKVVAPPASSIQFITDINLNQFVAENGEQERITLGKAREILNRYRDHVVGMQMTAVSGGDKEASFAFYKLQRALSMAEHALRRWEKEEKENADANS